MLVIYIIFDIINYSTKRQVSFISSNNNTKTKHSFRSAFNHCLRPAIESGRMGVGTKYYMSAHFYMNAY